MDLNGAAGEVSARQVLPELVSAGSPPGGAVSWLLVGVHRREWFAALGGSVASATLDWCRRCASPSTVTRRGFCWNSLVFNGVVNEATKHRFVWYPLVAVRMERSALVGADPVGSAPQYQPVVGPRDLIARCETCPSVGTGNRLRWCSREPGPDRLREPSLRRARMA
jgi:hypothetical protein